MNGTISYLESCIQNTKDHEAKNRRWAEFAESAEMKETFTTIANDLKRKVDYLKSKLAATVPKEVIR